MNESEKQRRREEVERVMPAIETIFKACFNNLSENAHEGGEALRLLNYIFNSLKKYKNGM